MIKPKPKPKLSKRRITMTIDADFHQKLQQLEIDVSAVKEEQAMNLRSPKSRSPRSPRSPSSGKPGGYAEMM